VGSSSESGSGSSGPERVVVDTNVIYSGLHRPSDACGKILRWAAEGRLALFSPDMVSEEARRVLLRTLRLSEGQVEFILSSLPVSWVPRGVYSPRLGEALR